MKKRQLGMIAMAAALAGVGIAHAHSPDGGKMFAEFDANHDGVVTKQEAESWASTHFDEADTNHDGKLTPEERKSEHAKRMQEHFTEKDTNKDGVLERSEVQHMPDEMFNRLDTDHNGSLSAAEMQAMAEMKHGKGPHHEHGDMDMDKTMTKADAIAKADERFQKVDTNGDGKVTQDEWKAHHEEMAKHHGHGHEHGAPPAHP